jgi:hypothetical protein
MENKTKVPHPFGLDYFGSELRGWDSHPATKEGFDHVGYTNITSHRQHWTVPVCKCHRLVGTLELLFCADKLAAEMSQNW